MRRVFALVALTALPLVGCSFSAYVQADKTEVEKAISQGLEEDTGRAPDDVSCPDDLKGEKGTTMTCTITTDGKTQDIEATVTGVENGEVRFDIEVDSKTKPTENDGDNTSSQELSVPRSSVEKQISDKLNQQVGRTPEKIECPGDLDAKVGTTMRCTLTDAGESLGITVTVTSVTGSNVRFDIEVDEA